ncbi:unnamed protein product, partial [Symbiodinium sp. KB8]
SSGRNKAIHDIAIDLTYKVGGTMKARKIWLALKMMPFPDVVSQVFDQMREDTVNTPNVNRPVRSVRQERPHWQPRTCGRQVGHFAGFRATLECGNAHDLARGERAEPTEVESVGLRRRPRDARHGALGRGSDPVCLICDDRGC